MQIRIGHKGRVGIDVRGHIHTGCTNTVDQVESIDTPAMITDTSGFNVVNVNRQGSHLANLGGVANGLQ